MRRYAVVLSLLSSPLAAQQGRGPLRDLPDPGVIATNQHVNPAGLQTVFDGRVTGTRFGARSGQIWVAVPGNAYLLDWAENRVIARVPFDGRSGVHGVVVDPVSGAALVSSVGRLPSGTTDSRLPGSGALEASATTQLSVIAADVSGVGTPFRLSGPLGDYMAGNPAIARTRGRSGRRLAILTLPANDKLAVLDADRDSLRH
ncbi:MAG: hypothetical protein U0163_03065 [Gemmatimonadaceae bacterium]